MNAMYLCKKFDSCSVPICPLDRKEGIRLENEAKCKVSQKIRRKLRSKAKNE